MNKNQLLTALSMLERNFNSLHLQTDEKKGAEIAFNAVREMINGLTDGEEDDLK